ncbi:MAG: UDP-N-acetylmuramoyl-L-alanyl-D-glutamate--2,6-diaminopimelate ligase [Flavobacteriaceae bacterium]|nr:UDP-N-acetylmuramoyl-L-alanyl-D-glutamate--2,6-diaminopimelate ligase [Flavobacteriaceae bacterium]
MMNLKDILYKLPIEAVWGSTDLSIRNITFDSSKAGSDNLFVAIKGTNADGHRFIEDAIAKGAKAVVCEQLPENRPDKVSFIEVTDSKRALALIAANFYDHPSEKLKLVGVTGTNGKTTVATLLYELFRKLNCKAGLLSTIAVKIDGNSIEATHTTPDSISINHYLNEMVEAGVEYCFMEVSSHGIHQQRTTGLNFAGGIFTNLTHDHLDYHKTFAEYRDVKKSFFDQLPKSAFALTNADDKNGLFMLQNSPAKKHTYAVKTEADFKTKLLENQFEGLVLKIDNNEVYTKLIGLFNAYNLTAIYGAAILLGVEKLEVLRLLTELETVSGRFQFIRSQQKIVAIVDYAHTPDALKNVLETINEIRTHNEKLITVVGCGGNRDKQKRPVMAEVAASMSDLSIFTSDNPRSEDPETIIQEMEVGIPAQYTNKVLSITDRKQAIRTACSLANPNDIILVAGKGHETYQEIKGVRTHFDDMETVDETLKSLNK